MFCNSVNYGSSGPCKYVVGFQTSTIKYISCGSPAFNYTLGSTCSMYQVNGTRYISWPHQNFCCACCTEEDGCGMLKPTWVHDAGGEYLVRLFCQHIIYVQLHTCSCCAFHVVALLSFSRVFTLLKTFLLTPGLSMETKTTTGTKIGPMGRRSS